MHTQTQLESLCMAEYGECRLMFAEFLKHFAIETGSGPRGVNVQNYLLKVDTRAEAITKEIS